MTRRIVLSVALVATISAVLAGHPADHGGHAASPPPGDELAGMIDPRVTQGNIQQTICKPTWTRWVQPPRDAMEAIKRNLAMDIHVNTRDYELDHIVPLDLGGAPLDLRNLMLQPRTGACNAHDKEVLERRLWIMVCAGDLTLNGAQHEIAIDWRAGYKKWINAKGCGTQ